MLQEDISNALKPAIKAREQRRISTLRLIMAAIRDREIAARTDGSRGSLEDGEVRSILQKMVKQRRDSIGHYEAGGRLDLATQEQEEIDIIEEFLPQQLDEAAMTEAAAAAIEAESATGIKEMGKVMAHLKERYAGEMDFSKAAALVRKILTSAAESAPCTQQQDSENKAASEPQSNNG